MKTNHNYIVIRTQKLIQHNHVSVRASSRKEALEFAKNEQFENAEYELIKEKFKVVRT